MIRNTRNASLNKNEKQVTVLVTFLICLWIFIPHSTSLISFLSIAQVAKLASDLNDADSSQPFFKKCCSFATNTYHNHKMLLKVIKPIFAYTILQGCYRITLFTKKLFNLFIVHRICSLSSTVTAGKFLVLGHYWCKTFTSNFKRNWKNSQQKNHNTIY